MGIGTSRITTSAYNVTKSAERDNDENVVIIDDPALARAYLDEFKRVVRAGTDSAALQGEQRGSPKKL
jgi:phosphatidylserine/phosphatidylglycerophosphate/cardiolipin synthase-like enzyme